MVRNIFSILSRTSQTFILISQIHLWIDHRILKEVGSKTGRPCKTFSWDFPLRVFDFWKHGNENLRVFFTASWPNSKFFQLQAFFLHRTQNWKLQDENLRVFSIKSILIHWQGYILIVVQVKLKLDLGLVDWLTISQYISTKLAILFWNVYIQY